MDQGVQVIFSVPGMVLATIFVSLPFVVREVMPVLQEIGTDQEEAAETLGATPWQTFWRVTLPAIRWGVTYGVVLATARALGEFGAVSVVAGNISGQTQTLPLFVKNQFDNFNLAGAYAAGDRARDPRDRGAVQHEPISSGGRQGVPTPRATTTAGSGCLRPTAHRKGGLRWPSPSRT